MATSYYNPNRSKTFNVEGQPLPSYVKHYLTHEATANKMSPMSVRNYSLTLNLFLQWLSWKDNPDISIDEVDVISVPFETIGAVEEQDIRDFLDYCSKERKNGASACASKLSVIKAFFDYHINESLTLADNPAANVSGPKKLKKEPKSLSAREALNLIAACNCGETPARDVCIATFILNTGIRVSELVALNLDDVDLDYETLRIRGKRRKDRLLSLNRDCVTALEFWLAERGNISLNDNSLFSSRRRGGRLTDRAVEQMLEKAFDRAGLSSRGYTVQSLRYTAGNLMYKSGAFEITDLQTILGHKNLSSVERYTREDNQAHARKAMKGFRIQ